jgi:hypothetical protein
VAADNASDPSGTLARALWIGGGQWAGKSTVARLLAVRHGLTAYRYDYHDACGHDDRRIARRVRRGEPPGGPDPESAWVARPTASSATTSSPRTPSGPPAAWPSAS